LEIPNSKEIINSFVPGTFNSYMIWGSGIKKKKLNVNKVNHKK